MSLILKPEREKPAQTQMPVVALRDTVVFPGAEATLTFGRPHSVEAINWAYKEKEKVFLVCQKNPRVNDPGQDDLYQVGTIVELENVLRSGKAVYVIVRGLGRAKLTSLLENKPFLVGRVTALSASETSESEDVHALAGLLVEQLRKAMTLGKVIDPQALGNLSSENPQELVNRVAMILEIAGKDKQSLLEVDDLGKRAKKTIEYLVQEIKVLELDQQISSKAQDKFDKSMREAILRQRREMIDRELGKMGTKAADPEIEKLRKKIADSKMPKKVAEKAKSELSRLTKMSPMNPESGYIHSYLEWLTDIPWVKKSKSNLDIKKAKKILDQDHYGLENIKERILEHLAVIQLQAKQKENISSPTILCFIGPPGVGKTSVGKSIARAMGRRFVRISLGGLHDEAEIRGHRRTYVGALPGRLIQAMKEAKTINPVFMLDEIDKVGNDFRGDPSAALLEALDPEQNKEFSDHYLGVPYDLSQVFFITTGNVLDTIPPALRDRMEVIRFPGYTDEEKYHIAKDYLWPKEVQGQGLGKDKFELTGAVYKEIIDRYTREAGVRQLQREMARLARKLARKIAEGKKVSKRISVAQVRALFGPAQFSKTAADSQDEVGKATGLAWTQAGGEILFIEVALMPGKGKILLTGKLGEVMKESCQAAISYVRSHWQTYKLAKDFAEKIDIHVHVPEGAVAKDGPSAGVAIASAVVSALTGKSLKHNVGMTGEITLRGRVLEIGGVKEKVLAAHRAGLKTVILPKNNKKDLEDIPAKIKKEMKLIFADQLNQVLKEALSGSKKTKTPK
ncbi:MAG: endopeptidase La [Candidatus Shapirobacteria bacterium]|nr:endopeptidase La [Candidatus Shapirobacteria bacterium]MDD5073838.1 endopeptidase La [Candidatus Shapirobacteria bacterium]MDD5481816.1 endopeptidase La [Candidatus Shapirobacteria bacterium]